MIPSIRRSPELVLRCAPAPSDPATQHRRMTDRKLALGATLT
ncbi:MAG: hypothetical protein ACLTSX_12835 [Collinsella sp.]